MFNPRLFQLVVLLILVATFLWKSYEAWHKYNKGDKMLVTKVKHPKNQTFPSVTLCKGVLTSMYKGKNISELVQYNSQLDNWLIVSLYDGEKESQLVIMTF